MSLYVLTVTLHLVAMVAWVGTMIAVPAALSRAPAEGAGALARQLQGPVRLLATPALLLTWAFGIANAVQGDWWTAGWLQAKLALVLALSALYGVMAGQLRRAGATGQVPALLSRLHWVVLALLAGAILLAQWKPA